MKDEKGCVTPRLSTGWILIVQRIKLINNPLPLPGAQ